MQDCVIIGAGPGGLTAALYLARYRRSVTAFHDDTSRALRIPLAHNVPGFPDGVAGKTFLANMRHQAERYGARIKRSRVREIRREAGGFVVLGDREPVEARTIVLATGVEVTEVDLPRAVHEAAIDAGCLRYCPVCDGFEASGEDVAVLGGDRHGAAEALFLRQYTDRVTLLARHDMMLSDDHRQQLVRAGVSIVDEPVSQLSPGRSSITVGFENGEVRKFRVLYPALGRRPRSEIAVSLRSDLADGGVVTDQSQRTSEEGVFAVGDLVEGLDQITVAMGHGAVAATKVHNYLRDLDGEALI